ncbi:hypothetical protein Pfo_018873 [Paulownia fortunei]|nr:hypothetical protein Pfo_018873 [Paulownia fortunei]
MGGGGCPGQPPLPPSLPMAWRKKRVMRRGGWYAVVLVLACIAVGVRPDASDHKYKVGDSVPLYANKVGPFHNPRSGSLDGLGDNFFTEVCEVRNLLLTGGLFCGPLFLTFCFLNTVAIAYNVTAALPFGTIVVIFLIWALVASPLLVVGGIAGKNSKAKFEAPCHTNNYNILFIQLAAEDIMTGGGGLFFVVDLPACLFMATACIITMHSWICQASCRCHFSLGTWLAYAMLSS